MKPINVLIMGAAGRDFHVFNTYFRDNDMYHVAGFTAAQIPDIADRTYPAELAGELYPTGIQIYPEVELPRLVEEHDIDQVVFAYSDLSHEDVMHKASIAQASGADFRLMGPKNTSLTSKKPVIAVSAVRTGAGKSQTTIRVADELAECGLKAVIVRHPMPYGDLSKQVVQRFATMDDLDRHHTTIEEREEFEPHVQEGTVVYAGVDYEKILQEAEKEADVIIWDGGNNDFPFIHADLEIVVTDPLRPGQEVSYHPGEVNFRRADVIIINKIDSAIPDNVQIIREHAKEINPEAVVIEAASPILVENYEKIKDQRVLIVEDGPTLTHGGIAFGAGLIAAEKFGAKEIVDPHSSAVGSIAETFADYPHIVNVLPAMGYSDKQCQELEQTIKNTDADLIVTGTPIDLTQIIDVDKPLLRTQYTLQEIGHPNIKDVLTPWIAEQQGNM